MEFHPVANIFPLMDGREFEDLVEDIRINGLMEPVTTYQGRIIDGRNRYRACLKAEVKPRFIEFDGCVPLINFIVSLNLHRRQLNESQRAIVAAKIATMKQGERTDLSPNGEKLSQGEAADLLNVGKRTVERANEVIKAGTPELIEKVESGKVSVSAAAEVASLPKPEQQEVVARGESEIVRMANEIKARKTDQRRTERIEKIISISRSNSNLTIVEAPSFPVILCDPPWRYEHAVSDSRVIENQYPTMELADICALPIQKIALSDCVLFLWATSPKLEESLQVIKAWGFSYRTCAVWNKEIIGMGYYFRQQHELLLVATRGNLPPPKPEDRLPSIFDSRRTKHSEKPEVVYGAIERMYPELPKIELFARGQARSGWSVWGNESRGNIDA